MFRHMIRTFLRVVFILLNNFYCIPTYLIWMFTVHPFKPAYPRLYDAIEGTLYSWLLEMVAFWIWSANAKVYEMGDSLEECYDEKCLVLCNHQSTSDVPLLMYYMSSKSDVTNKASWIMDVMFKHTNFGWVSQVHHDFFIKQGKDTRGEQLDRLKRFLKLDFSTLNRKWLIIFPEGGFFYKRKESSKRYASAHGYVDLDYCTLPRTGALWVVLSTLVPKIKEREEHASSADQSSADQSSADRSSADQTSGAKPSSTENNTENNSLHSSSISKDQQQQQPHHQSNNNTAVDNNKSFINNTSYNDKELKWIVDLTLCYPRGEALSIAGLVGLKNLSSPPTKMYVISRKYPITEVSHMDERQFQDWLFQRWAEKDEILRKFYETGDVPDNDLGGGDDDDRNRDCVDGSPKPTINGFISKKDSADGGDDSSILRKRNPESDRVTEEIDGSLRGNDRDDGMNDFHDVEKKVPKTSLMRVKSIREAASVRKIEVSLVRMVGLHVLFIGSTIFHCGIIYAGVSAVFSIFASLGSFFLF